MPRDLQEILFVGIKNVVVALRQSDGAEIWRATLEDGDFVTVLWDGEALFAANDGEVFRLDPATGAILWQNPMKGLRTGVVSLATVRSKAQSTPYETIAEQKRREAAAAHGAAAGGAA